MQQYGKLMEVYFIVRKLLNTLYIMTEESYLVLDGENIVVQKDKQILGRFPLHTLENIVCFTYKGASPDDCGPSLHPPVWLRKRYSFWRERL